MAKWHSTKDFLKLRREWYRKLSDSGFRDTEVVDWGTGETLHLPPGHVVTTDKILRSYGASWELVRDFYAAARAHTHVIESEDHPTELKEAWRLFAEEGLKFREISRRTGIYRARVTAWLKSQAARFWHLESNAGRPPAPVTDPTFISSGVNTMSQSLSSLGPTANGFHSSVSG